MGWNCVVSVCEKYLTFFFFLAWRIIFNNIISKNSSIIFSHVDVEKKWGIQECCHALNVGDNKTWTQSLTIYSLSIDLYLLGSTVNLTNRTHMHFPHLFPSWCPCTKIETRQPFLLFSFSLCLKRMTKTFFFFFLCKVTRYIHVSLLVLVGKLTKFFFSNKKLDFNILSNFLV